MSRKITGLTRVVGFEPTHNGTKIRCLTVWRYPYVTACTNSTSGSAEFTVWPIFDCLLTNIHGLSARCLLHTCRQQLSQRPTSVDEVEWRRLDSNQCYYNNRYRIVIADAYCIQIIQYQLLVKLFTPILFRIANPSRIHRHK